MWLIDADAVAAELIKWRDSDQYQKCRFLIERWVRKTGITVLLHVLNAFPTIEAEPVKRGRWISDDRDVLFSCSECGTQISTSWDYEDLAWNYCPNCGAKMDGERTNTTPCVGVV